MSHLHDSALSATSVPPRVASGFVIVQNLLKNF